MKEIELIDGSIVEFPDDMSDAEIEAALKQLPPPPLEGFDPSKYGDDWKSARKDIQALPEAQRKQAAKMYYDSLIAREREGGGVGQAANDYARMFSRNLPFVGEWLDEARADLRSNNPEDYQHQLALEHARRRAIDAVERPGVETPWGRVDTGDLAKTGGFLAGMLVPGGAAGRAATTLGNVGIRAAQGALMGGADAGIEAAGVAEGTAKGKLKAGLEAAPLGIATGGLLSGGSGLVSRKLSAPKARPVSDVVDDVSKKAKKAWKLFDKSDFVIRGNSRNAKGQTFAEELLSDFQKIADERGVLTGPGTEIGKALREVRRIATTTMTDPRTGTTGTVYKNISARELDRIRKTLGTVAEKTNKTERTVAGQMAAALNDKFRQIGDGRTAWGKSAVVQSGNPKLTKKHLKDATRLTKIENDAKAVAGAIEKGSKKNKLWGNNAGSKIRRELEKVEKKRGPRLEAPQQERLRAVTHPNRVDRALNTVAEFSPLHNRVLGALGAAGGAAVGGPLGLLPSGAAAVSGVVGDARSQAQARALLADIVGGAENIATKAPIPMMSPPGPRSQAMGRAYDSRARQALSNLLRHGSLTGYIDATKDEE